MPTSSPGGQEPLNFKGGVSMKKAIRWVILVLSIACLTCSIGCVANFGVKSYRNIDYPEKAYIKFYTVKRSPTDLQNFNIRIDDFSFGTLAKPKWPTDSTNYSLINQPYIYIIVPPGEYVFDIAITGGRNSLLLPISEANILANTFQVTLLTY
jgi:hypothetical protein